MASEKPPDNVPAAPAVEVPPAAPAALASPKAGAPVASDLPADAADTGSSGQLYGTMDDDLVPGIFALIFRDRAGRFAFSLAWPFACLGLCLVGLPYIEFENNIGKLWVSTQGNSHYKDMVYKRAHQNPGSSTTLLYTISHTRKSDGNHFENASIQELIQRMKKCEKTEVVVDDRKFAYEDFCAVQQETYKMPCFVMSALDAFEEGGFRWDERQNNEWIEWVYEKIIKGLIIKYHMIAYSPPDMYGTDCEKPCKEIQHIGHLTMIPAIKPCNACVKKATSKAFKQLERIKGFQVGEVDKKHTYLFEEAFDVILGPYMTSILGDIIKKKYEGQNVPAELNQ